MMSSQIYGLIGDQFQSLNGGFPVLNEVQIYVYIEYIMNFAFLFTLFYILVNLLLLTFQKSKQMYVQKLIRGVLILGGILVMSYICEIPITWLPSQISEVV